jgi:ABC-type phosphate transport system substrate-binding protein
MLADVAVQSFSSTVTWDPTPAAFSKMIIPESDCTKTGAIQPGNGQMRSIVENTPDAIGYIWLQNANDQTKVIARYGAHPTPEAISNGTCPIVRTLCFSTWGMSG